jgi:hypothetical protein
LKRYLPSHVHEALFTIVKGWNQLSVNNEYIDEDSVISILVYYLTLRREVNLARCHGTCLQSQLLRRWKSRRVGSKIGLGKKCYTLCEKEVKRWKCSSSVQRLPSKPEALSSNPRTTKKKKKRNHIICNNMDETLEH